jgi:hypothetical protein
MQRMAQTMTPFVRALFRTGATLLFCAATDGSAVSDSAPRIAAHETVADASIKPDDSWNAVFDRHDGWTGADVAGTVALGDGRMLWLFGDTWIGSIRGGRRLPGAKMVNNTIAVHSIDQAAPWKAPDPRSVHFYWGAKNADGRPTAWVVPSSETTSRESTRENREWLWPTGGGLTVEGPGKSRRLYLFLFRVRDNPRSTGVWGFSVVGTALAVIENAAEPVDRWKMRLLNIPHSVQAMKSAGRSADAEMTWGMTACRDPDGGDGKSPAALIYGVRKTGLGTNALVLASAPATIDRFDAWSFYAGRNSWAHAPSASVPLAQGLVSEFSVERLENEGRTNWVLVQSEPFLGKRILLRTAPQPHGPWSAAKSVATVPDLARNRSYFTYAAKGHVALSRPGELLITYLVNSNQFSDLMTDTQIYRPRFLRLSAACLSSR